MHCGEPKQLYPRLYKIVEIKVTHNQLLRSTGGEDSGLKKHKQRASTFSPRHSVCLGESGKPLQQGTCCAHSLALLPLVPSAPGFLPFFSAVSSLYDIWLALPLSPLSLNSSSFSTASTCFLSHIPGSGGHTAAVAWWPPYPQRDRAAHTPAARTPPAGKGPKGSPGPAPETHKGKSGM